MDALWQSHVADTARAANSAPVPMENLDRHLQRGKDDPPAPRGQEEVPPRGLLERLLFSSMGKLVALGYRTKLEEVDIPPLQSDERVGICADDVQGQLDRGVSLLRALLSLGRRDMWMSFLFAFMSLCMSFVSPWLIYDLTRRLEDGEELTDIAASRLLGFLLAPLLLVYLDVMEASSLHRVAVRVRGAFSGVVFRKSLRLTPAAMTDASSGAILNLMNTHATKVFRTIPQLNKAWQGLTQIAVAVVALVMLMGSAGGAGVGMLALLLPVYAVIAGRLHSFYQQKTSCTDARLKQTVEMVTGIRVLKLFCWEDLTIRKLAKSRDAELGFVRAFAYVHAALVAVIWLSPLLASLVMFITFSATADDDLTASTAFTGLSLFLVVRLPLLDVPMVVADVLQAKVALARLQDLLDLEETAPVPAVPASEPEVHADAASATLAWAPGGDPVLTDVSFRVPTGKLTCVVGSVGSGKSSLVAALLGDLHLVSGSVRARLPVSLAAQTPWIKNATVRDNILMGQPFDRKRYQRVLEACALLPDLATLPSGEHQEIGERGISLSGGQKARVSLARAVYRATEDALCMFDDPLSAVDVHVGQHIFEEVLQGMLKGHTRLLVTNQLWTLQHADHIIVLDAGGRVAVQGSYAEVSAEGNNSDWLPMLRRLSIDSEAGEEAEGDEAEATHHSTTAVHEPGPQGSTVAEIGQLTTLETRSGAVVSSFVYWAYVKSLGGGPTLALVVALFLLTFVAVLTPDIWLSYWLEDDGVDTSRLVVGYTIAATAAALMLGCKGFVFARRTVEAGRQLHDNLLRRVIGAPMEFFDTTPTGRILNRFAADLGEVDSELGANLDVYLSLVTGEIVIVLVISVVLPLFILPLIPLVLVFVRVQRWYRGASVELMKLEGVTRSPVFNHFQESLAGCSTIRALGLQAPSMLESCERLDVNHAVFLTKQRAEMWILVRLGFLGSFVMFFVASFIIVMQDELDPSLVGFTLLYALQAAELLRFITILSTIVEDKMSCVERILEYADVPQERHEGSTAAPPAWPSQGAIRFDQVCMRYRDDQPLVLQGLDFSIAGGEKVGIVGRTGAGKSSIAVALFRLVELAGGRILIDGVDVSRLSLRALRSVIDIVPQDPTLVMGTVRSNVDLFDEFEDEQVREALRLVNLQDAVALDTEIEEGGSNLSVGQRQLVCLARALVRKPRILVMDESTASVDHETDALIQRAVRSAIGAHVTVLSVAHRLHTIMDSDRILVLDAGRVVENGSPAALLAIEGGVFAGMAAQK